MTSVVNKSLGFMGASYRRHVNVNTVRLSLRRTVHEANCDPKTNVKSTCETVGVSRSFGKSSCNRASVNDGEDRGTRALYRRKRLGHLNKLVISFDAISRDQIGCKAAYDVLKAKDRCNRPSVALLNILKDGAQPRDIYRQKHRVELDVNVPDARIHLQSFLIKGAMQPSHIIDVGHKVGRTIARIRSRNLRKFRRHPR